MARKRAKKIVKQVAPSTVTNFEVSKEKEPQNEKLEAPFTEPDVERQISAIRAIRDVEIEHVLTELHLLRSCFTSQQLQTPVLQYFKENYQNLSIVGNENGKMEVEWVCKDGNASMNEA